jgi:ribosome-associated toxin RatA of RatAB toxin-antitoxin module
MLWVTDSRIRGRYDHTILVEMTICGRAARKRFSAAGDRPHRIDIISRNAMFDRFIQHWIYEPVAAGGHQC